jgi:hypothetical protein
VNLAAAHHQHEVVVQDAAHRLGVVALHRRLVLGVEGGDRLEVVVHDRARGGRHRSNSTAGARAVPAVFGRD